VGPLDCDHVHCEVEVLAPRKAQDAPHSAAGILLGLRCVFVACHFSLILTALKVAKWTCSFTPIATALAALVTQLFLGFRCLSTQSQTESVYRRIRHFTSRFMYGVVILPAIPSFILGMTCSIEA
jgi:hypothetical protein